MRMAVVRMRTMLSRRDASLLLRSRSALLISGRTSSSTTCFRSLTSSSSTSDSDSDDSGGKSRRFRQHVNPLAQQYRAPIELPEWHAVFADPSLPIHLDIGCARGKYLMAVAQANALSTNYVGVEIRQNVIAEASQEAARRELANLAFLHANMNFQQQLLIPSLPSAVASVSIFHPDPWMKKRHLKRRLVTHEFVTELADLLRPGTPIYVQTDLEELFEYMVGVFELSRRYGFDALHENPLGIPTDREKFVRDQGGDIFRVKFTVEAK